MAKKSTWYVTRKPSEAKYQLYDFARSAQQAKDMLESLAEGKPVAHKSRSEGGNYNIYVEKGSVLWRKDGGSADISPQVGVYLHGKYNDKLSNTNQISYEEYDEMVNDVRSEFNISSDESHDLVDANLDGYGVQVFKKGGKLPKHDQKRDMEYKSAEEHEKRYKRKTKAKKHPSQMEDGGEIESVAKAIYEPNEFRGKIETTFGNKTLKGLENMIADNDAYDVYLALRPNFEGEGDGEIATTYGDKNMKGLIAMIENAKGGSDRALGGFVLGVGAGAIGKTLYDKRKGGGKYDQFLALKEKRHTYYEDGKKKTEVLKKGEGFSGKLEERLGKHYVFTNPNGTKIKVNQSDFMWIPSFANGGSTSYAGGGELKGWFTGDLSFLNW